MFVAILAVSLTFSYFGYKINLSLPVLVGMVASAWYGGRGPGILYVILVLVATAIRTPIPENTSTATLVFAYFSATLLLVFIVWLVSGRKTASLNNKKLRRQNDLLLNSAGEGIIGLDAEGKCTFLNPAAAAMVGWSVEELQDKQLHDLSHHTKPDGTPYPSEECPIRAACKEGRSEHVSGEVFWTRDGASFPVEYTCTPVLEDGISVGAVIVFRDISEQKRAERELQRQALLLDQSHEAIFMWDFDDGIIYWNKGSEGLYGYTGEEAVGRVCYEMLQTVFPVPLPEFLVELQNHGWWSGEVRQRTKSGGEIFSSSRYQVIEYGGRKIVLQTNRDITDRRRAEAALRDVNETLEQKVAERTEQLQSMNKELEAFTYSVSHDLRAPLRAIDGFSRIFVEDNADKLDDEGKRVLDVIRANAQNMGQLIDDLLAFSRLGRKQIETTSINMNELAHSVRLEFQNADGCHSSDFNIEPLPAVNADEALMRQVLVNLFSNAVKYSRTKNRLQIEVGSRSEEGEIIYFVRDQGVGFDMNYANKLFGVFQRLHTPEQFEGTGVGLAIVQRVIHRHGGRVWAEAEVDKGATFYFALPQNGRNPTGADSA